MDARAPPLQAGVGAGRFGVFDWKLRMRTAPHNDRQALEAEHHIPSRAPPVDAVRLGGVVAFLVPGGGAIHQGPVRTGVDGYGLGASAQGQDVQAAKAAPQRLV